MATTPSLPVSQDINPSEQENTYVHDVYNEIASHFSKTRYKPWPIVERFLTGRPKYSVGLDVGCGNGKYLNVNQDLFIIGSDRSSGLINCAQEVSNNQYNLAIADGLSLPHPNDEFDFAISIAVIHHFATEERRIQAISHILSKLKKGAQCLIYCWALEQENSRRGYREGDDQDVLIPWVLHNVSKHSKKKNSAGDNSTCAGDATREKAQPNETKYRYYHLYKRGELSENALATGLCTVADEGATDLDALSCRYNMDIKRYLDPPDEYIEDLMKSYNSYLQFCTGYTSLSSSRSLKSLFQERKLPIINRGTYLRTKAITDVVEEFIREFENCQIISLGSGSDTRAFSILEKSPHVVYHEIDFADTAKIKKLGIMKNNKLRQLFGIDENVPEIESREAFDAFDPDLHYKNYHLHGADLREAHAYSEWKGLNFDLPTIVLSECVLCYLSPEEYSSTIKYWTNLGNNLTGILIYEPMSLRDSFGQTMYQNLQGRGLNLQTFDKYPNLESRLEFLKQECNLSRLRMTTLSSVGGYSKTQNTEDKSWIGAEDLRRINSLEFVDEIEEIRLLLEHYCLCYGEFRGSKRASSFKGIDQWPWHVKSI
ncbi:PPM1 [Candida theae]|uniref:Leucine carboxyl methyltransferase 1 n=1 Tax=Candida theae TaxID=1198502 RepID=A0AAD5BCT4_9ASCO|nr:PPM1 [Candida theae]KAI5952139.1 PPM1 [Candida theae]